MKTFIIPINIEDEEDLFHYGILNVKKESKNKKIFTNEDRLFCYRRNSKELFGPIYVYDDRVIRRHGDINNLQIECYIKNNEKVHLIPYKIVEHLTEITNEDVKTLLSPFDQISESTTCPPSITGDYELDGFLSSIWKYRKKYQLGLPVSPSNRLFLYVDKKMKECNIDGYTITEEAIYIENEKIINDFINRDFTEYLKNDEFANAYLLTYCCMEKEREIIQESDHIVYMFKLLDDSIEDNLDNTLFPIRHRKNTCFISCLSRFVHPLELLNDVLPAIKKEPEITEEFTKSAIPDKLRFELSLSLLKNLIMINGYTINSINVIDNHNSSFNLTDYNKKTLNLLVTHNIKTIPRDITDYLDENDLLLMLLPKSSTTTVKEYSKYIEFKKQILCSDLTLNNSKLLDLNKWTIGEFVESINAIWGA